jgi:hypothetical protein
LEEAAPQMKLGISMEDFGILTDDLVADDFVDDDLADFEFDGAAD